MVLTGKLVDANIDFITHKPKLTFTINEKINSLEEIENVEILNIEVKKYRKKRSLDANRILMVTFTEDGRSIRHYKR